MEDSKRIRSIFNSTREAEKRDHRKIGKEMNLFHFQDDAPGMVFWHPAGWTIYTQLKAFMRKKLSNAGYKEVSSFSS